MEQKRDSAKAAPTSATFDDQATEIMAPSFDEEAAMTAWLGMTIAVQHMNQQWAALLDSDADIKTP